LNYSDSLLQGFETSALVFFAIDINGMHNNRVFSRCISNLILVINEDAAKSLQLDETLSLIIPIYGLLLKEKLMNYLSILFNYYTQQLSKMYL
jgi:hypothetical protein